MITFFPFLLGLGLVTGLLGQSTNSCFQRYASCVEDFELCSEGHYAYVQCLTDTTAECYPLFVDVMKGSQNLVEEECRKNSTFVNDWLEMGKCVMTNIELYRSCELEGEFRNAAEVCSSLGSLIKCFSLKTREECGETSGTVYQKISKPMTDFTESCEKSRDMRDYILPVCYREMLKCDHYLYSRQGYSCSALERNFRCYADVLRKYCVGDSNPYVPVFERYVEQIPDYCNPESPFRQNLGKSYRCIIANLNDVIRPCYEKYQRNMEEAVTDGNQEAKELIMAVSRVTVQLCHCIARSFDSSCGEEAAFVARYLLNPIEELMDNLCLQLTEEKCSGTVALECSIVLLILSFAYILMKKDV